MNKWDAYGLAALVFTVRFLIKWDRNRKKCKNVKALEFYSSNLISSIDDLRGEVTF